MKKCDRYLLFVLIGAALLIWPFGQRAFGISDAFKNNIYNPGALKPMDSVLKLRAGDRAPDFTLKSVSGEMISLKQYRGKKNVVISFVPLRGLPFVQTSGRVTILLKKYSIIMTPYCWE